MLLKEFKEQIPYNSFVGDYKVRGNSKAIHIVFDMSTARIACFSFWNPTVNVLAEMDINTTPRYHVNYVKSTTIPLTAKSTEPYMLCWDYGLNEWAIKYKNFSFDELYYYNLFMEKAALLDLINERVSFYRRSVMNSVYMQESVHLMKAQEAQEILADSDPEDHPTKWPLVYEYAEYSGVSLKEAANEILFQYRLQKTKLCNTESLRIRYTRELVKCKDLQKLEQIFNNFVAEGELYGKL